MGEMLPELLAGLSADAGEAFTGAAAAAADFWDATADTEAQALDRFADTEALNVQAATRVGSGAGSSAGVGVSAGVLPAVEDLGAAPAAGEGSAAAVAAADPAGAARGLPAVPTAGDPVDVATGDVVMGQVDVRLPGGLELVVQRAHRSGYRTGRWLGPSWVSTLDQRLEITEAGVFFAAADGSVLSYPHPEAGGEPVWPVSGARWPLARDGDGYAVSDPQAGTVRRFEARSGYYLSPGGMGELPLVSVTSRAGHQIAVGYALDGTPVSLAHDGGYQVNVEMSGGRVAGLTLACGVGQNGGQDGGQDIPLVGYRYDCDGNLAEVVNSSAAALRFCYDSAGRLTRWQDRNGWWYRYHYDSAGRCVRGEGPDGMLSGTFGYERRITTYTDEAGGVTVYELTEDRRLAAVTDPLGHTTRYTYDAVGYLVAQTDPLGRTTRWDYDELGNLTRLTRPDGSRATVVYDEQVLPAQITEPGGVTWRREFDARGCLTQVTAPDGAVTGYAYDARGNLAQVTDPLGGVTTVTCNPAGLPVSVTGPDGATTRYERDALGRVTAVTAPDGLVTRLAWTTEGLLASRTFGDGSTEQFGYDGEHNLVEHRDAAGAVTRLQYACFDVPVSRSDPSGTTYTFGYDTQLRLTTVTNPAGLTWDYEYDRAGNLVAETDFDGAAVRYAYDAAGQLVSRTNAAGQRIEYRRDALGRVTQRHVDQAVFRYSYDAAGCLLSAAGPGAQLDYTRDALGRVLTETVNGRTVASTYDPAGNRTSRRTPGGVVSQWTFDLAGRPAELSSASGHLAFGYDQAGREISRMLGVAASLTQTFDALGRLTGQHIWAHGVADREQRVSEGEQRVAAGGQRVVQARSYAYRADGMPTEIDDALRGKQTIGLDWSGRVLTVSAATWTEAYAYDALGNLAHAISPAARTREDRDREFRGTRVWRAGRTRYRHDAAGRVVQRSRRTLSGKARTWTYAWDADDRLTAVTTPDGRTWRYSYDPLGRRIAKEPADAAGAPAGVFWATVSFTWDGSRLAEEGRAGAAGEATTLTWDYLPGTFVPAAQTRRTQPAGDAQDEIDAEFHAIVADLTGAPSELVAADGSIAWHITRSAWGQTITAVPSQTWCPLGFPGQYLDPETGHWYNLNRYYDPETATYLSGDPLGLAPGPNPHAYVPNPLVYCDPLGLQGCGPVSAWGGRVTYGKLDDQGRPTGITATIEHDMIGRGSRPNSQIRPPGFLGGAGGDSRGHLLGKQLGGSGSERRNLVALYQTPANSPVMSGFEDEVRQAVDRGERVEYEVTPIYNGDQPRPRAITIEATGSRGTEVYVSILNWKP